jgi:hypothetical protein
MVSRRAETANATFLRPQVGRRADSNLVVELSSLLSSPATPSMASAAVESPAGGLNGSQSVTEADLLSVYADLVAEHAPGFATGDEDLATKSLEVAKKLFDQGVCFNFFWKEFTV